jgi:hypothetical protein
MESLVGGSTCRASVAVLVDIALRLDCEVCYGYDGYRATLGTARTNLTVGVSNYPRARRKVRSANR